MAKQKPQRLLNRSAADFWALITIAAFPVALVIASTLGATPISAFLFGMYGSLAALTANAITEGQLWMFVPHWQARFEHPEFSFRLAVISGTILLLVESVFIVLLFTGAGIDRSLLAIVFQRQCATPAAPSEFCRIVSEVLQP